MEFYLGKVHVCFLLSAKNMHFSNNQAFALNNTLMVVPFPNWLSTWISAL